MQGTDGLKMNASQVKNECWSGKSLGKYFGG